MFTSLVTYRYSVCFEGIGIRVYSHCKCLVSGLSFKNGYQTLKIGHFLYSPNMVNLKPIPNNRTHSHSHLQSNSIKDKIKHKKKGN